MVGIKKIYILLLMSFLAVGCSNEKNEIYLQGNLDNSNGTPTLRSPHTPKEDDPHTTNDESNDQELGHYGTETLEACTTHNNTCYTLDAEITDGMVQRVYFQKGGWVDFIDGEFDGERGWGEDELNREWEFTL
jgi:hypothetical protein